MEEEKKCYTVYDVHAMAEERCGRRINNYELATLISCWRIKRGLPDEVQEGFTIQEAADFLAYMY